MINVVHGVHLFYRDLILKFTAFFYGSMDILSTNTVFAVHGNKKRYGHGVEK